MKVGVGAGGGVAKAGGGSVRFGLSVGKLLRCGIADTRVRWKSAATRGERLPSSLEIIKKATRSPLVGGKTASTGVENIKSVWQNKARVYQAIA